MFIDSHAHIDGPEFNDDREEVIQRAENAGVAAILNVGTGDPHSGDLERAVTLAESREGIFAAVGVHPHDARHFDANAERRIVNLIDQSRRIVAWGEIGLDFHYDNSPRQAQRDAFRRQLELAKERRLPVIVHSREAEEETIDIIRESGFDPKVGGVMHCFSGSQTFADAAVELGFFISFSGIVTFKKAIELQAVAVKVPMDRLLIETDCPYLAPVPYRGKRNEPAYVVEVARRVAELKEVGLAAVEEVTTTNFSRLFGVDLATLKQREPT
jgi:TatD DNase family protein